MHSNAKFLKALHATVHVARLRDDGLRTVPAARLRNEGRRLAHVCAFLTPHPL
jgi:hypothetical protein